MNQRFCFSVRLSAFILSFIFNSSALAGEMLNSYLPDFVKVDIQLRHRMEYRENLDFNNSAEDRDAFDLLRSRIGIYLLPCDYVEFFTQFQDARIANSDFVVKTAYEDYMDLRQLNLNLKNVFNVSKESYFSIVGMKMGRQELSFGSQRLIGPVDWSNVGQTFDAGRMSVDWANKNLKIDFFGGTTTPNKSPREANDLYDGSTYDRLGGYYLTWKAKEKTTIDQYLIQRKTNKNISFGPSGSAELDEYTLGARAIGNLTKKIDYEFEGAGQWGDFDEKNIAAFMIIAIMGYTFDASWSPRIAFEYNYGSGDNDSSDSTRATFDNLYPTNHLHYGFMDLISLQNINNYRLQVSAKPHKKLKVQADWHFIYLDAPTDSLYAASRAVTRTTSDSSVSTHVGNEIDLWAKFDANSFTSVVIGYSHFFAGEYLKDTGANDDGDFAYIQTTLNF